MSNIDAVTIDNATGQIEGISTPGRYRAKLDTAKNIRKEMAKTYRQCRSGVIDAQTAAKLTWCLSAIATVVRSSDIELRLDALEKAGD